MDYFYIITNEEKDKDLEITNRIQAYIESHGKTCVISKRDGKSRLRCDLIPKEVECALVLGGDGTLIRAARELAEFDIPLLGINLGTLGYLTEVEIEEHESALQRLFANDFHVEERMMLRGKVHGQMEDTALNDVVVTRDGCLRTIRFHVYVNEVLLHKYSADGIIVSTPTGSTGYNLSAGGPIVQPTASIILLTPICPHDLNASSIVLSPSDRIMIQIIGDEERQVPAVVTFDGVELTPLKPGEGVTIRKSSQVTKIIKLSKESFMHTMRNKMKGSEGQ